MSETSSYILCACKDSLLLLNPQLPYREALVTMYEMPGTMSLFQIGTVIL